MKIVLFNLIFFSAYLLFATPDENGVNDNIHERSSINLNLDKETATKIAESIFVYKFGEKIKKERPWIVTEDNGIFKIKGTFHYPRGTKGGVVEIVIRKSDAKVLSLVRGK